jgi:hypothetical protein
MFVLRHNKKTYLGTSSTRQAGNQFIGIVRGRMKGDCRINNYEVK